MSDLASDRDRLCGREVDRPVFSCCASIARVVAVYCICACWHAVRKYVRADSVQCLPFIVRYRTVMHAVLSQERDAVLEVCVCGYVVVDSNDIEDDVMWYDDYREDFMKAVFEKIQEGKF